MIYDYACDKCSHLFEVVKPMKDSARAEKCVKCKSKKVSRVWSKSISLIGTAVESPEYNPAFGMVVKNKYHRAELAKQRGMVEIGNENPNRLHSHFDAERLRKRAQNWEKD